MNCTARMQDGVYNCFGVFDSSICYECIFNEDSESKDKSNKFVSYEDRIEVLYEYLVGKLPDGVKCFTPKLSLEDAFSVIWFLQ